MNDVIKLSEGFGYCEVIAVYSQTIDRKPLLDKNGNPMILISWSVVDKDANISVVKTYISAASKRTIANLENVMGIQNLYDSKIKQFQYHLLKDRCCCAVIRSDETYINKIEKYIPLEFFNYLTNKEKEEETEPNPTDIYKKEAPYYTGLRFEDAKRLLDKAKAVDIEETPF
jgi:hypothetical protein